MEPVPPPHERPWRHPSELAPPPLEETPRRVRIVAAVTGAASVALVGLFALTVTPSNSPVMVTNSTMTSSVMAANVSAPSTTLTDASISRGGDGDVTDGSGDMTVVMIDASVTIHTSPRTDRNGFPLATVYFSPRLSARGSLIAETDDVSIVRLDPHRPQDHALVEKLELTEYVVASSVPSEADEVTALGGSPQHVRLDDVDELDLEPGTAVVDENNHLVAVSGDEGDLTLVAPDPDPDPDPAPVTTDDEVDPTTSDPTTTDPPTTPEPTESSTPDTTMPPTSVDTSSPSTPPKTPPSSDETTTSIRTTSPRSTKTTTTTTVAKSPSDESD